jgi:hypothetical protein
MLKTLMFVLLLLLGLPIHTQAQSSDDQGGSGCGPSRDGWDVKTAKEHTSAPKPPDGKARVYVVQTMVDAPVIGGNKATTRVGLDGPGSARIMATPTLPSQSIPVTTVFALTGNRSFTLVPVWPLLRTWMPRRAESITSA